MSASDHLANWCWVIVLPVPNPPGIAQVPPFARGKNISITRWPVINGLNIVFLSFTGRGVLTGQCWYNLKSDVLRVGHHGGRTSSNEEFLEKVNPDYSIISLGKDNTYGHPHKETISRLDEVGTKIMRTDELGDIVIAIKHELNIPVKLVGFGEGIDDLHKFDAHAFVYGLFSDMLDE